ncbi:MAG: hypothetical protein ACRC33_12705, partial [Gemmataceae bacterium]
YADTDGFDTVFEAALVDQAPVVLVRTENTRPDWEGRLNAWIAAWNAGGPSRARTLRGQSPAGKLPLDADSLKELRLLIGGLLDRVETAADRGSTWWANERTRSRRVALLKPYSLRFHRDGESPIRLIFFHGNYAAHHPAFLRSLMKEPGMEAEEWSRTVDCSRCMKATQEGVMNLVRQEK